MKEEMTIKLCVPCRVIVFAPCLSMQESVAGGRQCVAVSLELVGSLVESYQHGLSDVSSILPLQQLCWGSYRGERIMPALL